MTDDVYSIAHGSICREERGYVSEAIYTNDPDVMVKHCLSCAAPVCNRGECPYTRCGEGKKKYIKKSSPPLPMETVTLIVRMRSDGWRKKMIARELGLTIYQVERSLAWNEKEAHK